MSLFVSALTPRWIKSPTDRRCLARPLVDWNCTVASSSFSDEQRKRGIGLRSNGRMMDLARMGELADRITSRRYVITGWSHVIKWSSTSITKESTYLILLIKYVWISAKRHQWKFIACAKFMHESTTNSLDSLFCNMSAASRGTQTAGSFARVGLQR